MQDSIYDELFSAAEAVEKTASNEELGELRERARQLVESERLISRMEQTLSELKNTKNTLAHKTLPDLMNDLGLDRYGYADAGVDLELKPYAKASIPQSWDEEKQEAGYAHLEELGVGDIIRHEVTIVFGRDSAEEAEALKQELVERGHLVSLKKTVPWNTLTATVKELAEKGAEMDLERIGAVLGEVVKLKERK